ncbi:MAG: cysteine desulfurase family protein [Bacilli bacterium]
MENNFVYLDNAASSEVYEEVLTSFSTLVKKYYSNPSSIHKYGQEANYLLDNVREKILNLLKLSSKQYEVVFTSGATESNNLAIKGYCLEHQNRGNHIITSKVEHPSVLEAFNDLEKYYNFRVSYIDVDEDGSLNIEQFKKEFDNDTIFVSFMHANNETGAINDVSKIKEIIKTNPKTVFHSDAVQSVCKIKSTFDSFDMFTFTAHKIHGLKGIGVLIKKKSISLRPLLSGGGQEYNYRSGTASYPLAYSLFLALDLSLKNFDNDFKKITNFKNILLSYLLDNKELYHVNSKFLDENPYILNFSTLKKKASVVVEALSNKNIFISSISSCHSKKEKNSYVVKSMYPHLDLDKNTIRVSFSTFNNEEDVYLLVENLKKIMESIR